MLKLYDVGDGGEVVTTGDDLKTENTPLTSIYLSLFGGSLQKPWFGNMYFVDQEERQMISTFENELKKTLLTTESLKKLKPFLDSDLQRLVDLGILKSFETSFFIKSKDKLEIIINFVYDIEKTGTAKMDYSYSKSKLWILRDE